MRGLQFHALFRVSAELTTLPSPNRLDGASLSAMASSMIIDNTTFETIDSYFSNHKFS
jgi:hypothetical protein